MMFQLLSTDPGRYFAVIIVVVVSIVLHELAHGVVAIWLGDRTPIETGHMTLNPIVHMGLPSLVLLAIVGFAWGQMPVNRSRLRGRYGDLWVSAAGPAMNLILAAIGIGVLTILIRFHAFDGDGQIARNGWLLLWELATTNIALALLNLVPIPPLDGSRMLADISPGYRRMISSETARGVVQALLFALFFAGGRYIFPLAEEWTLRALVVLAGAHVS